MGNVAHGFHERGSCMMSMVLAFLMFAFSVPAWAAWPPATTASIWDFYPSGPPYVNSCGGLYNPSGKTFSVRFAGQDASNDQFCPQYTAPCGNQPKVYRSFSYSPTPSWTMVRDLQPDPSQVWVGYNQRYANDLDEMIVFLISPYFCEVHWHGRWYERPRQ